MLTLWDLLPKKWKPPAPPEPPPRAPHPTPATASAPVRQRSNAPHAAPTMRDRYETMTRKLLTRHGVRVRKWRTSMSGVAWQVTYADGTISRLIEAPRPKGPMSAAVFLHEIGHHAIGFNVYKPRCLEELRAWEWALAEMERQGLNITDSVRKRMDDSLRYAVAKARRRGLKRLPTDLLPYATTSPRLVNSSLAVLISSIPSAV
ncbi:MAG: hypothetical protein EA379_01055, partial [Phycisphaerales bacterium]